MEHGAATGHRPQAKVHQFRSTYIIAKRKFKQRAEKQMLDHLHLHYNSLPLLWLSVFGKGLAHLSSQGHACILIFLLVYHLIFTLLSALGTGHVSASSGVEVGSFAGVLLAVCFINKTGIVWVSLMP